MAFHHTTTKHTNLCIPKTAKNGMQKLIKGKTKAAPGWGAALFLRSVRSENLKVK